MKFRHDLKDVNLTVNYVGFDSFTNIYLLS